ncbi:MAG: hypothetical protein V9G10_00095 [Candidatus Nanopelagicales bacterium]
MLDRIRNKRERDGHGRCIWRGRFLSQVFRGQIRVPWSITCAHLSSAFHVSPFDEAVVVSVDGFGDFASAAWGLWSMALSIDGG